MAIYKAVHSGPLFAYTVRFHSPNTLTELEENIEEVANQLDIEFNPDDEEIEITEDTVDKSVEL